MALVAATTKGTEWHHAPVCICSLYLSVRVAPVKSSATGVRGQTRDDTPRGLMGHATKGARTSAATAASRLTLSWRPWWWLGRERGDESQAQVCALCKGPKSDSNSAKRRARAKNNGGPSVGTPQRVRRPGCDPMARRCRSHSGAFGKRLEGIATLRRDVDIQQRCIATVEVWRTEPTEASWQSRDIGQNGHMLFNKRRHGELWQWQWNRDTGT